MEIGGSALVTGASRGIGRAVAIELANRGFRTIATMRDVAQGASLAGEVADGALLDVRRLDVTDPDTFELPDDLRVLVNNAGVDSPYRPVEHTDLADWRALFETNVVGVVALTQAAIGPLRRNQPAVVCSVTSSSILAAMPFYAPYRASKAAVSAFNDSLRVEVAGFGIRVVEILPGPIDTDMFELSKHGLEAEGQRFPEYLRLATVADQLRRDHADPQVSSPAVAARRIVNAILDDDGPMRYGCDPLSDGLLELWRQTDDETVFLLTGQSLIDQARAPS